MWPWWAIEGTQATLEITNATMEMVTPSSKGEDQLPNGKYFHGACDNVYQNHCYRRPYWNCI